MSFEDMLAEIRGFWIGAPIPFRGGGAAEIQRLQRLFAPKFPAELEAYIGVMLPKTRFRLVTVGNPIELYGVGELAAAVPGYS